ncbi:MAG: phosphatase PAP2 family protein [Proteobacteria bacterium]|nr:phosphatase PAP2 family protein [Pseudomonadota bacterium]
MRKIEISLPPKSPDILALELVDYSYFIYATAILVLLLILGRKNSLILWHLSVNALFLAMAVSILYLNARRSSPVIFFCKLWYVPFLYVFLFEEMGQMIYLFRPVMFDPWILSIENKVFGGYPTVWLQKMASPVVTEVMSLFYMSYYFLIPVLGMNLYFRRELDRLNDFILTTSVTFFTCFLHYLAMPVAGPIFVPSVLPFDLVFLDGGPFTTFEQWLFFKGAIQGGAFPSSHVAVAVAVVYFAARYGKSPFAFAVTATGLAISTVYNGYHYGVDVLYGIAVGLAFSLLCPPINRAWKNRRNSVMQSRSS